MVGIKSKPRSEKMRQKTANLNQIRKQVGYAMRSLRKNFYCKSRLRVIKNEIDKGANKKDCIYMLKDAALIADLDSLLTKGRKKQKQIEQAKEIFIKLSKKAEVA